MKKITYILFVSFLGIFSSCNKAENSKPTEEGFSSLDLSFATDESLTKSEGQGYEETIRNIQLLLFDDAGTLDTYRTLSSDELAKKKAIISDLKIGDYTVVAIANGPVNLKDSISTLEELHNLKIDLKTYNVPSGDGAGFVMSGSTTVTIVRGEKNTRQVTLSRYAGRVVLTTIQNKIPVVHADLTVENVYITNVVSITDLAGTDWTLKASAIQWLNKEGRDEYVPRDSSRIIDGITYKASAPELTYSEIKKTIPNGEALNVNRYFYGYTNSSIVPPHGFNPVFEPQRTVLVVVASIAGIRCYYPVPLTEGISRNTTTNVKLTVIGWGTEDPAVAATKGKLLVDVKVSPWVIGESYNPEF